MDFKSYNPAFQDRFDVANLFDSWNPRLNFYTGRKVRPGLILAGSLYNPALVHGFVNEVNQLAQAAEEMAMSTDLSAADRTFLFMARLSMLAEADYAYDPTIGRPGPGFNSIIGIGAWLKYVMKNHGSKPWVTPEVIRAMISHWLFAEPGEIEEAMELWFGGQSVGLLNADERIASLEAFSAAMSDEALDDLLRMWTDAGGEANEFRTKWWQQYVLKMALLQGRIRLVSFKGDVRRGYAAYAEKFSRLQIRHNVDEIKEWAEAQYALVTTEMDRLAAKLGYSDWKVMWNTHAVPADFPDGEALVMFYRQTAPGVLATLQANGLIPPPPADFDWSIVVTPPANRVDIPIAACYHTPYESDDPSSKRTCMFVVTPAEGDLANLRQHFFSHRITIAHELGAHGEGTGIAPYVVPLIYVTSGDTSIVGMEGVAFSMEPAYLQCDGVNPKLEEVIAMLQGRAWRYARVIAETDWHLSDMSFEQVVQDYTDRSQLSLEMARRDMRRAAQDIWQFMPYAFGASGVYQMGQYYSGGFREALSDLQASTGGMLPPNVYLWATNRIANPREFNWLCETDPGVETSQQLFA